MEVLIIGVYVMVNLIVYVNDHMVAESMNQKLKEMRKRKEKFVNYDRNCMKFEKNLEAYPNKL